MMVKFIIFLIMNFDDLTSKILDFIKNNNSKPYLIISNCYYNANIDIKKIQELVKIELNLNEYKNDIMESYYDDYFIFKLYNQYIVINTFIDCFDNIEYKIIKVSNRIDALTYRYG